MAENKDKDKIVEIICALLLCFTGWLLWDKFYVHRSDSSDEARRRTEEKAKENIKLFERFYDPEMEKYTSCGLARAILTFPFDKYQYLSDINYQNEAGNNLLLALAKSFSNDANDTAKLTRFLNALFDRGISFDATDTAGHTALYYCNFFRPHPPISKEKLDEWRRKYHYYADTGIKVDIKNTPHYNGIFHERMYKLLSAHALR
jgi:hypothetical protein